MSMMQMCWVRATGIPGCVSFRDSFTGPAGDIDSHTPDKAPAGFKWVSLGTPMVLSGIGTVVPADSSPAFSISDAIADGWTPLGIPTSWELSLTCRMPG